MFSSVKTPGTRTGYNRQVLPPVGGTSLTDWPDLPIAAEVHHFLYGDEPAQQAIKRLMRRPPKAE
ncbi:hypothetical protein JW859_05570 [bacterium]|nr:hypothetical protein [bacterium]